jgi:DNA helicase-2/ATP-dependent DNA helicase PcrA
MNLFEENYNHLNPAQKQAVDTIEGPVMVVAGPGTGKTQILTLRIANILRLSDTAPANILALTFTENATANMRRRLAEMIGSSAYQVVISTFHGFCNTIIKNYPEDFPRIVGSTSVNEVDQATIIEHVLEKLPVTILRPIGEPIHYVRDIIGAISELKREGVTVEEYRAIVETAQQDFENNPDVYHQKGAHKGKMKGVYTKLQRTIEKNRELSLVYEAYETELVKRKLYDYDDMIMEVLRELRTNATLLSLLQEEHQYILVDEHQDTNNAQNKILELIVSFHDNPNLFVVGDEKQAVFRFQGASLENFYYFHHRYPQAQLIALQDNYRSTQHILDTAHGILAGKVALTANSEHPLEKIRVARCASTMIEHYFVAQDIKQKIESGVMPAEIAILYRNNSDALPIATMLEKTGIAFAIDSDDDLLNNPDVYKFILLCKAVHNFGSDELIARALHIDFLQINPLDTFDCIKHARDTKQPLITILTERQPEIARRLGEWQKQSHNLTLTQFASALFKESGLLNAIITSPDARKRLATINAFFTTIRSVADSRQHASLGDLLTFIDTVNRHHILLKNKVRTSGEQAVRLMTVHKSKGLEFEHIYIIGAYDGHFGGRSSRDKLKLLPEVYRLTSHTEESKPAVAEAMAGEEEDVSAVALAEEDERRLFYVALTRAKRGVTISYASESDTGREQVASQFVTELRSDLIEEVDTSTHTQELETIQQLVLTPTVSAPTDARNREYFNELFQHYGLSATALNNYLTCPWQYFYRNLVKLPTASNNNLVYGNSIHAALNDGFKHLAERPLTAETLIKSFEYYLRREPLTPDDLTQLLEKGRVSLTGWYNAYHQSWQTHIKTEFNIAGVYLTPEIKLNGKLDKIEFIEGTDHVNVVDYKTGRPKSHNELMGLTATGDGGYYRQLTFYKLLLSLYDEGKPARPDGSSHSGGLKMVSGEIDFIDPNDRGVYKKEHFVISDEEVSELAETVKRVAGEIMALSFWDTTCDDKKCEYCALRALMK